MFKAVFYSLYVIKEFFHCGGVLLYLPVTFNMEFVAAFKIRSLKEEGRQFLRKFIFCFAI
ncbi:hypothetical protein CHU_1291 [Cytophaga hutchinsonii ATCC 33406]|uniref:Uncharacterized protein n=1 Tax=Cytophaga hutchinsonii (strain ATCC 33406 / DSM 1761 / CIP 103989 / NBRC 15051 / NCIMB 9469 / D465) TaxID=269798 RepID=A0A6N4SQJ5_CYTH3|nr:hypothetical protein CHU_1291 [Cytophaga hutchinsonii ATCC 33406]